MKSNFRILVLLLGVVFCSTLSAESGKLILLAKSAIIPGWGELSSNKKSGYLFLANESALWYLKIYYNDQTNLKKEKCLNFAYANADLRQGNYSEEFLGKVGKYSSSGFGGLGYNESIVREAKIKFPDGGPQYFDYIEQNSIGESQSWEWNSLENKSKYSKMWKRYGYIKDYSKLVTGVIIVNHIASVINCAIDSKKTKKVKFGFDLKETTPIFTLNYDY